MCQGGGCTICPIEYIYPFFSDSGNGTPEASSSTSSLTEPGIYIFQNFIYIFLIYIRDVDPGLSKNWIQGMATLTKGEGAPDPDLDWFSESRASMESLAPKVKK